MLGLGVRHQLQRHFALLFRLQFALGTGMSDMAPGSVHGLQLVVEDVEAARAELAARGVEVSEVQDFPWGSFVFFSDPDGNSWSVQQIQPRG